MLRDAKDISVDVFFASRETGTPFAAARGREERRNQMKRAKTLFAAAATAVLLACGSSPTASDGISRAGGSELRVIEPEAGPSAPAIVWRVGEQHGINWTALAVQAVPPIKVEILERDKDNNPVEPAIETFKEFDPAAKFGQPGYWWASTTGGHYEVAVPASWAGKKLIVRITLWRADGGTIADVGDGGFEVPAIPPPAPGNG